MGCSVFKHPRGVRKPLDQLAAYLREPAARETSSALVVPAEPLHLTQQDHGELAIALAVGSCENGGRVCLTLL